MLNFAEQTGSGAVILVWSILTEGDLQNLLTLWVLEVDLWIWWYVQYSSSERSLVGYLAS